MSFDNTVSICSCLLSMLLPSKKKETRSLPIAAVGVESSEDTRGRQLPCVVGNPVISVNVLFPFHLVAPSSSSFSPSIPFSSSSLLLSSSHPFLSLHPSPR